MVSKTVQDLCDHEPYANRNLRTVGASKFLAIQADLILGPGLVLPGMVL